MNLYFDENNKLVLNQIDQVMTGSVVFSDESLSLFARMTEQPSYFTKFFLDRYIRSLISNSLWPLIDVLRLSALHTEQSSLLNIKGDYWNGTKVSTPTFTINRGWTGSLTKYINSGFNPSLGGCGYVQNSNTIIVHYSTAPTIASPYVYNIADVISGTWMRTSTINNGFVGGQVNSNASNTQGFGFSGINGYTSIRRLASNGFIRGKNTTYGTQLGYPSVPIYNGVFYDAKIDAIQSVIMYGAGFTDNQLNVFQTLTTEYLTSIVMI